jgi:hypothetical protein
VSTATAFANNSPPEPEVSPPIAVDLLAAAIEKVRPLLTDKTKSTKARVRILWASVMAARGLAASDRVHGAFGALSVQVGLINNRGWWVENDVRACYRRYGLEDVDHVIIWALRGLDPFDKA